MTIILVSGRTSKQGIGLEEGKLSKNYIGSVNKVQLHPDDAKKNNVELNKPVKITSDYGSVIVHWEPDENIDSGHAFFPYGPWVNQLYSAETEGTGMPILKGINVSISSAKNQQVPTLEELLKNLKGGKGP